MKSFLDISKKYKQFIFDCDGVLWKTGMRIPNAFEALHALRKEKK